MAVGRGVVARLQSTNPVERSRVGPCAPCGFEPLGQRATGLSPGGCVHPGPARCRAYRLSMRRWAIARSAMSRALAESAMAFWLAAARCASLCAMCCSSLYLRPARRSAISMSRLRSAMTFWPALTSAADRCAAVWSATCCPFVVVVMWMVRRAVSGGWGRSLALVPYFRSTTRASCGVEPLRASLPGSSRLRALYHGPGSAPRLDGQPARLRRRILAAAD
jgi:hypothetical protein